jgi:hypothetical protein
MPIILAIVGILGVALTGLLVMGAVTSNGLGVAIILPAALAGLLLAFILIGVAEMLRALWSIERHLRKEADDKAALAKKVAKLERVA